MAVEPNPCLVNPSAKNKSQYHVFIGGSQKKKSAPASPIRSNPMGAEFHRSDLTWNPLYDKYLTVAMSLRQALGPRKRRCPRTCDIRTCAIMKMPMTDMKNATVDNAKT